MHTARDRGEGLGFARLLMVLSSLSPLFVLLSVRGNCLFPDRYFVLGCACVATLPTLFLFRRVRTAFREGASPRVTGVVEDNRHQVLVYLFATLLPFYREEIGSFRDLAAMAIALAFIVFLFWRLNLYYLNVLLAVFDYHIYTVGPSADDNPYSGKERFILITKRRHLSTGESVNAYRLSNSVFLERPE